MPAKLYTVEEAAAYLRLAPQAVYRKCKDGTLRHRRIEPRTIRFTEQDLKSALRVNGNGKSAK